VKLRALGSAVQDGFEGSLAPRKAYGKKKLFAGCDKFCRFYLPFLGPRLAHIRCRDGALV